MGNLGKVVTLGVKKAMGEPKELYFFFNFSNDESAINALRYKSGEDNLTAFVSRPNNDCCVYRFDAKTKNILKAEPCSEWVKVS